MIHFDQHMGSWWLPPTENYYPLFQIWTSELTFVCAVYSLGKGRVIPNETQYRDKTSCPTHGKMLW